MMVSKLVFLVEEPSMEAFLHALLPRILPGNVTFDVHPFQGKSDLLRKLKKRLCGYAQWLPKDWRIIVIVDRDDNDCLQLKKQLEEIALQVKLCTRSNAVGGVWQVVNRIAIEELEAWYFGDWQAVCSAFPKVSQNIVSKAAYRDPDSIKGGTWEVFERVLQRYGYFKAGFRKIEAAKLMGECLDPVRNRSKSFTTFNSALVEIFD